MLNLAGVQTAKPMRASTIATPHMAHGPSSTLHPGWESHSCFRTEVHSNKAPGPPPQDSLRWSHLGLVTKKDFLRSRKFGRIIPCRSSLCFGTEEMISWDWGHVRSDNVCNPRRTRSPIIVWILKRKSQCGFLPILLSITCFFFKALLKLRRNPWSEVDLLLLTPALWVQVQLNFKSGRHRASRAGL